MLPPAMCEIACSSSITKNIIVNIWTIDGQETVFSVEHLFLCIFFVWIWSWYLFCVDLNCIIVLVHFGKGVLILFVLMSSKTSLFSITICVGLFRLTCSSFGSLSIMIRARDRPHSNSYLPRRESDPNAHQWVNE